MMVALENLVPPIPSEIVLPMAGFLAGQGRLSFPLVILAATIGSVVGALVLYMVGHKLGQERLKTAVRAYGKFLLLDEQDIDRAQHWFERHGTTAVLLGRLIPGVRSLISIPAVITHMSIATFIVYTAIGSTFWNTILIGAGWALGHEWERVQGYTTLLEYTVIGCAAAAAAWYVWRRRQRITGT
jgi:membrane protein DedA with SNARE-associated domain